MSTPVGLVTAVGRAIGIDFVGTGTAMGGTERAAVLAQAHWNNATGASRTTALALADETGAPSSATLTWSANRGWATPITDQAGDRRLMKGYLDTSNTSATTVTVAGLSHAAYDVYVYADGDNGSAARTGAYRITGDGITPTTINLTDAANANFNGTFTRAANSNGNYLKFSVVASGFTLTATPVGSSGTRRAPVNAVQIVPTAPPSPDFVIASTPGARTVTQGDGTSYSVTVTAFNGFAGPVNLSVTGLPANASATFTPPLVDGAGTSTMDVVTAASTPAATSSLVITGTSGAVTRTAAVSLTVTGQPHSISGDITPAGSGEGATVRLGGAATASTTADAVGHYNFTGLVNGAYVVTPTRAGFVFTPSGRNVAISDADVTSVDFLADPAPPTYSISGTIGPVGGGAGATVTMTGEASATTTADSSGNFSFNDVANGSYTITPGKPGYGFTPTSQSVVVDSAPVGSVNFTALGPTKVRANSYDDAWEAAWVNHGRSLLAAAGKTSGFVLEIGDSITHSFAYALWPLRGQGRTAEDAQVLAWARATTWGSGNLDVTHKNGWYLAGADTTSQRGMTSSGGLSVGEMVTGCCNGGPVMPANTTATTARQLIANPTYTGNLQIDTLVAAFADAQFAVVMLGTNDPGNPNALNDLTAIVDRLEAAHVLPILSTIPPRNDGSPNQLNVEFNQAVTALARARSLPLIDFYREVMLRRPGTTWVNTLISSDGVHPTASGGGFTLDSDPYVPGGDAATHTTGDALANVGYLLRSWLTVQKLKEVKSYVIDGIDPS